MIDSNEIQTLFNNPEDSYVIHCAYFEEDMPVGSLKKIICVHAKNLNSTDSREFSIYNFASKNDIPHDDIEDWFDDLELSILDEFNSFLKEKSRCSFIYFGEEEGQGLILDELKRIFETRNKADAQKIFKEIPINRRKNIPYIFQFDNSDKNLKNFIKRFNENEIPTTFLSEGEEGANFEKKQYNKIRESVSCKIDCMIKVLNSHRNKSSSQKATGAVDIQSLKPVDIIKNMNIKSWAWLIGIAIAIFSAGYGSNEFFENKELEAVNEENDKLKKTINKSELDSEQIKTFLIDSIQKSYSDKEELKGLDTEKKADTVVGPTNKKI